MISDDHSIGFPESDIFPESLPEKYPSKESIESLVEYIKCIFFLRSTSRELKIFLLSRLVDFDPEICSEKLLIPLSSYEHRMEIIDPVVQIDIIFYSYFI